MGGYAPVDAGGDVLAYLREHDGDRFLVALNLGSTPALLDFSGSGVRVLSTDPEGREGAVRGRGELRGDEGVLVRLSG